jgi:hypothetical protein
MVSCVVSNSQANILNLVVFVIKAFIINLKFNLYIRLLSVKVYIIILVKKLIRIVYFSLILCVYNICI